jgi:hypothetical protein
VRRRFASAVGVDVVARFGVEAGSLGLVGEVDAFHSLDAATAHLRGEVGILVVVSA